MISKNNILEMKRGSLGAPTIEPANINIVNTVRTEDGDEEADFTGELVLPTIGQGRSEMFKESL